MEDKENSSDLMCEVSNKNENSQINENDSDDEQMISSDNSETNAEPKTDESENFSPKELEMEYKAESEEEKADEPNFMQSMHHDEERYRLERQLNFYLQREIENTMDNDLRQIQEIDPSVTSLDDLSPIFFSLRFNDSSHINAHQAFLAAREVEKFQNQKRPASMGSLTTIGDVQDEYFSGRQLDKLTSKQLDNPEILKKAMKSLSRLK